MESAKFKPGDVLVIDPNEVYRPITEAELKIERIVTDRYISDNGSVEYLWKFYHNGLSGDNEYSSRFVGGEGLEGFKLKPLNIKFKSGDIIVSTNKNAHGENPEPVIRRIVDVEISEPEYDEEIGEWRGSCVGYLWEYPYLPSGESNLFTSHNSNDPELYWWKLKD